MGRGQDLAKEAAGPEAALHHQVLEDFKDQLVVALLKRLADKATGVFEIQVSEVDATGDSIVSFAVRPSPVGQVFHFEVTKKQ